MFTNYWQNSVAYGCRTEALSSLRLLTITWLAVHSITGHFATLKPEEHLRCFESL